MRFLCFTRFISFMRVAMIMRPSFCAFIAFINEFGGLVADCFASHLIAVATVTVTATATAATARLIVATFGCNALDLRFELIAGFCVRS